MMSKRLAIKFIISGRVQGVGFRWFTKQAADEIGVLGYVRNMYDGRVETVASGDRRELATFRKRISEGPRFSSVSHVEELELAEPGNYSSFEITY